MATSPTLSVLLPNYNHGQYIGEALTAMLSQSFADFEVILVDDASTDNSLEIIQPFVQQDDRVRLVCNEQNQGAVFSLNRALQLAQGEFIYSSAADDCVLPGFFETGIKLLRTYPQAGLCATHPAFLHDETGEIDFRTDKFFLSDQPVFVPPQELVKYLDSDGLWIAGHASLVRRSAFVAAGGFLPDLRWHCDWFALHVVALRHGICYTPAALAAYRLLPNAYSASAKRRQDQQQVIVALLNHLSSPAYADVSAAFWRSRLLSSFGWLLLQTVLTHPRHWTCLGKLPLVSLVRYELRKMLSAHLPPQARQLYRKYRYRRKPLSYSHR
ncbi:MAG: glycosyltransferase family 2 protein [Cyanobacteria bacterium]|nr:glycosyltransferase family 2 protein [Cyanobacteriota bacterium]MDW8202312.1 glycosyltransferase family 2 protein [Cyanobacteriota bacterium SKYGB_h_bin112]